MDLIEVFATWATEQVTTEAPVTAIPCALVGKAGGSVELAPISDEHPLSTTCHFVGGIRVPEQTVNQAVCSFAALYASLGVSVLHSILDGDCAFDVMLMMLGVPSTFAARKELRIEISDYLIERIDRCWMHDLMAACQELRLEDVNLARDGGAQVLAAPAEAAPAVADLAIAAADHSNGAQPDEETFDAMQWASGLDDDAGVLCLINSLPKGVVEEQVVLFRKHKEVVGKEAKPRAEDRIRIPAAPRLQTKMMVAQRFHRYCQKNHISPEEGMPYGTMKTFIADNTEWKAKLGRTDKVIRAWHKQWLKTPSGATAALEDEAAVAGKASKPALDKCMLRSRAPAAPHARKNFHGQGRHFLVPCIRHALYEWFTGIRYAIDWKQMIAENRSRGKKIVARIPRSFLRLKVRQLLQDYAYSCLLNGVPSVTVKLDHWWFKRWEEEYGLSMRLANRKYSVPRAVVKERMEIFWVTLFRVRLFIKLAFGYEPLIINPDQSPFHHNETGSQNQPTLAVRGSKVPVVEGNSDVKSRWTGFFTTESEFTEVAARDGRRPAVECMFKAEKDGVVIERLQGFLRSRGFPAWFTVAVGPKGSYREHDIISWLRKHLEPWREGRHWRIILLDDYSAHKTPNVWNLCWSCGYVRIVHGGGCTPIAQTPDTDLNEHARRNYGAKEARLLMEKMRDGQVVPKLTHEECMQLMLDVMSDPALHVGASQGYKKVGQTIDLYGKEDALVCREAGAYWSEETTDQYQGMRPKINVELAVVKDEWQRGGITWSERDVQRMIKPYPEHKKVDQILNKLGEDFYHDDIHCLTQGDDCAAVADGEQGAAGTSSDSDSDSDDEEEQKLHWRQRRRRRDAAEDTPAAVAGEDIERAECQEPGVSHMGPAALSAEQADAAQQMSTTIAALEQHLQGVQAIGCVKAAQGIEIQLAKERRRLRVLVKEDPAVVESFFRLRRAEDEDRLQRQREMDSQRERKRAAHQAIDDRKAAVAELRATRRKIQEMESAAACRHAVKTFTPEMLGQGKANAGGAQCRKNRMDVLDRLSRTGVGLSPGQRNDWPWFRSEWDKKMTEEHGADWATLFAKWVQCVLEDERSNAFSEFVYKETCRVFQTAVALHVPGS